MSQSEFYEKGAKRARDGEDNALSWWDSVGTSENERDAAQRGWEAARAAQILSESIKNQSTYGSNSSSSSGDYSSYPSASISKTYDVWNDIFMVIIVIYVVASPFIFYYSVTKWLPHIEQFSSSWWVVILADLICLPVVLGICALGIAVCLGLLIVLGCIWLIFFLLQGVYHLIVK
jgi:hypothetical protein